MSDVNLQNDPDIVRLLLGNYQNFKMLKSRIFYLNISLLLLISLGTFGCSESNFDLGNESRIPQWFELPNKLSRSDIIITMDYYIYPWGRKAVFKMSDKAGNQISKVTGKQRGLYPLNLKKQRAGFPTGYPSYEVITSGKITEVIEHRRMEPVFYITDDPEILSELEVSLAKTNNNKG
ncbi:MAG: hypothetical protein GY705_17770 [Bacteroidetes bacterium]|nr:hypothetical protein [Bacteroidota bacterium]